MDVVRQAWLTGCVPQGAALQSSSAESCGGHNKAAPSSRSQEGQPPLAHESTVRSPQASAGETNFSGFPISGHSSYSQVGQPNRCSTFQGSGSRSSFEARRGAALAFTGTERQGASNTSLEAWLHQSVYEIIHHLREAPFLHLVFDRESGGHAAVRQPVAEEFFEDPDSWTAVRNSVLETEPDGVILVHRLDVEETSKCYGAEYTGISSSDDQTESDTPSTAVWGLVVQSRGSKRHGCYILKTTRVFSVSGACTKFSLTRAKCFGPTLHKQLENSWLV